MQWRPHPGPQEIFCASGEFEVLFGGAAGPGKTICLIIEALRDIDKAGYRGLLLRRTFPQTQEIIDRCFTWYPLLGGVYRATEHRWYFPSGAIIQLGHMQHENDKYNYQGKEFQFVGFDELTQFTESQYLYLHSRIRSTDPNIPTRVRATTNPGGIGHYWVKARFVDITTSNTTYIDPRTGQSRLYVPATLEDNPTLFLNDPGYQSRLDALPEIERMRLRHGIWDAFEGQVFTELSQRVHGIEPFEIPHDWERFMVMDWGYAKPFSIGWYALDYDGILYRYRAFYGCKEGCEDVGLRMSPVDVARQVHDLERGERVRFRVADPAIWNKTPSQVGNVGPSVQEDMAREGIFFIKADNDRKQGKLQVHERFKIESEIDGSTGEILTEHPRFYCFTNDTHFWRTMMVLREDTKNPEDVDTGMEDHIYDEFRYGCMSRPVRPKKTTQIPEGSFASERKRLIRAKEYAKRHGTSLETAYTRVR